MRKIDFSGMNGLVFTQISLKHTFSNSAVIEKKKPERVHQTHTLQSGRKKCNNVFIQTQIKSKKQLQTNIKKKLLGKHKQENLFLCFLQVEIIIFNTSVHVNYPSVPKFFLKFLVIIDFFRRTRTIITIILKPAFKGALI